MASETLRWQIPDRLRPRRRALALGEADLAAFSPGETLRWPPRPVSPDDDAARTWARLATDFAAEGHDDDDLVEFA